MDQTVKAAVVLSITALPLCVIERPWSGALEKMDKGSGYGQVVSDEVVSPMKKGGW
jgi:hypothetical protein